MQVLHLLESGASCIRRLASITLAPRFEPNSELFRPRNLTPTLAKALKFANGLNGVFPHVGFEDGELTWASH